jgi:hypothetical protein
VGDGIIQELPPAYYAWKPLYGLFRVFETAREPIQDDVYFFSSHNTRFSNGMSARKLVAVAAAWSLFGKRAQSAVRGRPMASATSNLANCLMSLPRRLIMKNCPGFGEKRKYSFSILAAESASCNVL